MEGMKVVGNLSRVEFETSSQRCVQSDSVRERVVEDGRTGAGRG
jgi:hypothetical protein